MLIARLAASCAAVLLLAGCGSGDSHSTSVSRDSVTPRSISSGASQKPASGQPPASSAPITSHATPALSDLSEPAEKEIAMQLVSSAENSSLDWRAQYGYLADIGDGRGYTGGLIGFTSGTGDMLQLVEDYGRLKPSNPLARFVPALRGVNGTDAHTGLGRPFEQAWADAAADPAFRTAQDSLRDRLYFDPAVALAKSDGLGPLGQFCYYDAAVVHGPGTDPDSLGGIRAAAMERARTPAQGGDVTSFLDAFFTARIVVMKKEAAHDDVSRITEAQEVFLSEGNLDLRPPLHWHVYGDAYEILR